MAFSKVSEVREIMRQDIVTLISKDPFCPIARLLADALVEIEET